jgi:hypothetical protein
MRRELKLGRAGSWALQVGLPVGIAVVVVSGIRDPERVLSPRFIGSALFALVLSVTIAGMIDLLWQWLFDDSGE